MQNITIINTLEALKELQLSGTLGYDLETTGLNPKESKILLMQLATTEHAYVIDFTKIDLKRAMPYIKPFFDNFLIGANISFDIRFLQWHTGIEIRNCTDVMVNEQVLYAGKFLGGRGNQFSLAAITKRRLDIDLDKSIRDEFINYNGSLTEQAYAYAASDVIILHEIYEQQLQELTNHDLLRVHDLENSLLPVTAHLELNGVLIDKEKLHSLIEPIKRYRDRCEQLFQDLLIQHGGAHRLVTGERYYCVQTNSKPQVLESLQAVGVDIESLEAKKLARWDLRKNKETLQLFDNFLDQDDRDIQEAIEHFGRHQNPYLRAYTFMQGADKLLNTYVLGLEEKINNDGRWYPWFKQCGARSTGRYSSNAQQLPKNDKLDILGLQGLSIRECIIAPKGKKLIIADFAAIELVILAALSNDQRLIEEHLHGDIHAVVTREVLGNFFSIAKEITDKNKKSHPFDILRNFSKVFSYGIAYGVTGASIADQAASRLAGIGLSLSVEQGDQGIQQWKRTFADAGKFLDQSADMAVTKGYTTSVLGRRRWFDLNFIKDNKWRYLAARREGSNQRIQSTSADITKLAMLYVYNMLDRSRAQMILTIHDELVLECNSDYVEQACYYLKHGMQQAARDILPRLGETVIVDPQISSAYDK
jgi:DNA polymerase I